MSFLVCPGRSPEMMLLCLSACSIYNTLSISNRSRKKKIRQLFYILSGSPRYKSFLVRPSRSPAMMLLCLSASKIYKTFSIFIRTRKKKLCICVISFLFHPSRSPAMMLLCVSSCRIYNTFSISIRSWKKKLGSCSKSFLVHPDRSPSMMLLCLSASRIYNKSLV